MSGSLTYAPNRTVFPANSTKASFPTSETPQIRRKQARVLRQSQLVQLHDLVSGSCRWEARSRRHFEARNPAGIRQRVLEKEAEVEEAMVLRRRRGCWSSLLAG